MTPRVIDFEPAHLGEGCEAEGEFKKANGPCWTGVMGEQIIGSAGALIQWPGVAEAWISNWPRTKEMALWFHMTVRKRLREAVTERRLWRVQATVIQADARGRRWIELMGFCKECVSYHLGPNGEDCIRYYRIYRENLP